MFSVDELYAKMVDSSIILLFTKFHDSRPYVCNWWSNPVVSRNLFALWDSGAVVKY